VFDDSVLIVQVMVFKDIKGQLIQMVCTAHKSGDKWQYEAAVDDSVLHNGMCQSESICARLISDRLLISLHYVVSINLF